MKTYQIKNSVFFSRTGRLASTLIPLLTTLLLLTAPPAFAHKLNMFAYVEGDAMFAESYFTDGKKAKNSEVIVYDSTNNELLRGTTDSDGQISFAVPQQNYLRITVNAGMGHLAEYTLLEDELGDGNAPAAAPIVTTADNTATEKNDGPLTPVIATNLDNNALRAEVERAVGKAIKPLMRELSAMRAEKSFADIIGGIGFIFGLFGIAMYFKARKQ